MNYVVIEHYNDYGVAWAEVQPTEKPVGTQWDLQDAYEDRYYRVFATLEEAEDHAQSVEEA